MKRITKDILHSLLTCKLDFISWSQNLSLNGEPSLAAILCLHHNQLSVASLMHWKFEYSKTSPLAITRMDNADTTSATPSHCVGPLGLSATFLKPKHNMSISLLKSSGPIIITTEHYPLTK
jgi:hypothetical protein